MQWKRQGPCLDGEPRQLLCCQFPDLQFIHDLTPFTLPIAKQVSSLVDLYLFIVFLFVNFTYPYCYYLNFILVTFSHLDCYLSFYLVFLSSVSCFSITLKKKTNCHLFYLIMIHHSLPAGSCFLTALTRPSPSKTNTNPIWNEV